MKTSEDILFEVSHGVATLTIHRPEKLNAFRSKTLEEMAEALKTANRDPAVGVIVITGSGERAFSVGGDISEMKDLNCKTGRIFVRQLANLAKIFLNGPKPLIARVNGYCFGGGNEIQLFCDFTIASDRSVFGQTGPKVGSAPLWGASQILPLAIGFRRAKEVMFLCGQYPGPLAASMGLITESVPEEQLDQRVSALSQELLRKSPQSLRLLKQSLHRPILPQILKDLKQLESIYGSWELKEGMVAFLEKREPKFRR